MAESARNKEKGKGREALVKALPPSLSSRREEGWGATSLMSSVAFPCMCVVCATDGPRGEGGRSLARSEGGGGLMRRLS